MARRYQKGKPGIGCGCRARGGYEMARTQAALRRAAGFLASGNLAPTCPEVYSKPLLTAIWPGIPRARGSTASGVVGRDSGFLIQHGSMAPL